jgi:transposase
MSEQRTKNTELFALALGLAEPWRIDTIRFERSEDSSDTTSNSMELHIFLSYDHVKTGEKVHDRKDKTWRHLDFFQYKAFIHANVPRIFDSNNAIRQVQVPWAREGSGFTLLFEAFALEMIKAMPVAAAARIVREHDTRLWRVVHAYVDEARTHQDFSEVVEIGIDETSSKKGHKYISVFASLGSHKVIFCCEGKGSSVVKAFKDDFEAHNGKCDSIKHVSIDMSKAFICGVRTEIPNAEIVFDKFHVMKAMNEAVNTVRRGESAYLPELNGTRFAWLKNPENRTEEQNEVMKIINPLSCNWETARAYRYKLGLQLCFHGTPENAEKLLKKWIYGASRTSLQPVKDVAKMVKNHFGGIVAAIKTGITNGIMEGINSLIQAAKAKARGYRNTKTLCAIVYLMHGGLDFSRCFSSEQSYQTHTI